MSKTAVLYLMPTALPSDAPLVDPLVCRVAWALQNYILDGGYRKTSDHEVILDQEPVFHPGLRSKGLHVCGCGRGHSTNVDYLLPGGEAITNSLAVHYLGHHREEVPKEALDFLMAQAERHGWSIVALTTDDPIFAGRVPSR